MAEKVATVTTHANDLLLIDSSLNLHAKYENIINNTLTQTQTKILRNKKKQNSSDEEITVKFFFDVVVL